MENQPNPYATPEHSYPLVELKGASLTSKYGPFRSAQKLSKVLIAFLIVYAVFTFIFGIISLILYNAAASENYDLMAQISDPVQLAAIVLLTIIIGTIITFCIWTNRSMKNAWALSNHRSGMISPGWAVGWYFIPIASLWKPVEAVQQMRNTAFHKASDFSLAPWWTLWIIMSILDRISSKMPTETMEEYKNSNFFDMVTAPITIAACVFAILMVKKITNGHDQMAESRQSQ